MYPSIYTDIYKKSSSQRPPTGAELMNQTQFPNLNSIEYRQNPIERTIKLHPIWEGITINSQKHIAIGTNKCSGREWCSTLYGFENIHELAEKDAVFRLQNSSLITNIAYLSNNMIMATFRNGAVQLWSTYTQARNPEQPYCLFLIGRKFEHDRPVECLEVMPSNKAITGGQDFTLKIWEWNETELQSSNTYRYAHIDTITGISHTKTDRSIFTTCSMDKSVLLWDLRLVRPAHALFENHNCSFQDITWSNGGEKEAAENIIYVGDAAGYVHTIDKRTTKQFLSSEKLFERSIHKIKSNGDKLAVIANTNKVKVYSASTKKVIYENDSHMHFVRDCVWYDATKLLTVGCDSKLRVHNINS